VKTTRKDEAKKSLPLGPNHSQHEQKQIKDHIVKATLWGKDISTIRSQKPRSSKPVSDLGGLAAAIPLDNIQSLALALHSCSASHRWQQWAFNTLSFGVHLNKATIHQYKFTPTPWCHVWWWIGMHRRTCKALAVPSCSAWRRCNVRLWILYHTEFLCPNLAIE